MSQLDDLLGSLLGGKGDNGGGLGDILGQLTGTQAGDGSIGTTAGGGGALGALLPLLASFLKNGGLNKILSGFQQQGLGSQAASWVGTGANEPVSGAQVQQVLGSDEIAAVAQQFGISNDQAADAVAQVLPQLVDHVSPQGELPAESDLDDLFARVAQGS